MKLQQQDKMEKCLLMLSLRVHGFEEEEGPLKVPFHQYHRLKYQHGTKNVRIRFKKIRQQNPSAFSVK